jgi:hypothetical protein
MEREELLGQIQEAASPNDASTAIYDAREWLAEHPDDHRVQSAMADLIEFQRESLGTL